MKTATRNTTRRREAREVKEFTKEDYEQALQVCELASARIKSTSDELAAAWAALRSELSSGVSTTDLLRKRGWCNVLELRLKERTRELETARQTVDRMWDKMVLSCRTRELFIRQLKKEAPEPVEAASNFSLLARTALALAAEQRINQVKK